MRPGVAAAVTLAAAVAVAVMARAVTPREQPTVRPPGYVVDSVLPPGEALRRFRLGVAAVDRLDGPASRDDLLDKFMSALAANDSAAMAGLVVNRAEFAWLIYPASRLSRPPYRQPPEIAWLTLRAASDGGLRRLLARAPELRPQGYRCPDTAVSEGMLHITTGCMVRVRDAERTRELRLFGRIVELDGRWKFVGLDGDL